MGSSRMRRFGRFILSSLLPLLVLIGVTPTTRALAQGQPTAAMRLVFQSPWNGPHQPLRLSFQATNQSDTTMDGLSVVLSIHAPARSRSEYALSLRSDATTTIFTYPFPQTGVLLPGQTRTFKVRRLPLDVLTVKGETVLYPLVVQLLSGDTPVGTIRTPLIFLAEQPKVPLHLQTTWVFSAPLEYRPDGVFLPGILETDVSPGGRLEAMASSLEAKGSVPVDVVMSSVLADELQRMRAGFRIVVGGQIRTVPKGTGASAAAEKLLASLSSVARRTTTELLSSPFGDPSLPALLRSAIASDASVLVTRGRSEVQNALGVNPRPEIARPPYSQLDVPTTNRLRALGARALLIDPDFLVPPVAAPKFTPPPVVDLAGARRPMPAVIPDALVLTRAESYPRDPVLSAHVALGELATIWLEFPGTADRGVSVLFDETANLDPRFFPAFSSVVGSSPWLLPVTASELVAMIPNPQEQPIPTRVYPGFNPVYVGQLLFARTALKQFDRTAQSATQFVERLRTQLLLAEAGTFISDQVRGRLFIDSAYGAVRQTYDHVTLAGTKLVTLASRNGVIPVTLRNETGYTLRVRIVLVADRRVSFVNGDSRTITLPQTQLSLTFAVRADTTGRFPVKVRVETPVESGAAETITESDVLVRSTAYNLIALLLTIGAAVFLLGWWGRRFLPRRRS
jgi:Family of unknown function (DUF6049)